MIIEPLDSPQANCFYDENAGIAYIQYGKMISPDVTSTVYAWMMVSLQKGLEHHLVMRGAIFDFSHVESFYPGNIVAAKTESRNLRSEYEDNLKALPVALIATNDHQRMMVGLSMKQSKRDTGTENPMMKVVKTKDEALAFIASFQTTNA